MMHVCMYTYVRAPGMHQHVHEHAHALASLNTIVIAASDQRGASSAGYLRALGAPGTNTLAVAFSAAAVGLPLPLLPLPPPPAPPLLDACGVAVCG